MHAHFYPLEFSWVVPQDQLVYITYSAEVLIFHMDQWYNDFRLPSQDQRSPHVVLQVFLFHLNSSATK